MFDTEKMAHRLETFLAARMPDSTVSVDDYESVLGGFSRLTGRFVATIDGIPRTLIVRGDPPPERETAHTDRGVEWQVMTALHTDGTVPLPEPVLLDEDGSDLGAPAIVMANVEGDSLYRLTAKADDERRAALADDLVDLAVRIHSVDAAMVPVLDAPADWDVYIDGCIDNWRAIERAHCEPDPFIRFLATWLDANRPPPAPLGLVHGDYQSTNILVGSSGFVALDWELTHIGDPREDLGWCRWNEVIQPPGLIHLDEDRFCRTYAERSGLGEEIVNPATVKYFSILSAISAAKFAMPAISAFAQGLNSNLLAGYIVRYLSAFHQQFIELTREIEAGHGSGS